MFTSSASIKAGVEMSLHIPEQEPVREGWGRACLNSQSLGRSMLLFDTLEVYIRSLPTGAPETLLIWITPPLYLNTNPLI